jgi:hypothetical protein
MRKKNHHEGVKHVSKGGEKGPGAHTKPMSINGWLTCIQLKNYNYNYNYKKKRLKNVAFSL